MSTSEEILIKECQQGNTDSFGPLYDMYIQKIYNYIYYRIQHKETAEDIASLTFTKTLENIDKFSPSKGTFSSWIYRIAKNSLYDHFRNLKPTRNIDDIWDLDTKEDIERDADSRLKLEKIEKYMKTLKTEYREIIILRVWDGLSYKEIAEILGKNESNCKVLFSRAIAKIRDNEILAHILILSLLINN